MRDGVSHLCHTAIEKVARPAGFEPATPGLEVHRKEATRGSTTLLPLILFEFCQAPDHRRLLRAATDCQSFVSRLSPRVARLPIAWSSARMRHGHDQDATSFDSIDNAEREAPKQISTRSVIECRPLEVRMSDSAVSISAANAAAAVGLRSAPARGCFCLLESFVEIFKFAGHGRPPRGCGVSPPNMESSWRCRRRLDRGELEFPPTTPPRRRRPLQRRDSESALRRARRALRQRVEALRPRAAWHPCLNIITHLARGGRLGFWPSRYRISRPG